MVFLQMEFNSKLAAFVLGENVPEGAVCRVLPSINQQHI